MARKATSKKNDDPARSEAETSLTARFMRYAVEVELSRLSNLKTEPPRRINYSSGSDKLKLDDIQMPRPNISLSNEDKRHLLGQILEQLTTLEVLPFVADARPPEVEPQLLMRSGQFSKVQGISDGAATKLNNDTEYDFISSIIRQPVAAPGKIAGRMNELLEELKELKEPQREKLSAALLISLKACRGDQKRIDVLAEIIEDAAEIILENKILPKTTPEKYIPRGPEKASEFLLRVWGEYIEAGALYLHMLKDIDPQLKNGLRNEFSGRIGELRALIPNKHDEVARRPRAHHPTSQLRR